MKLIIALIFGLFLTTTAHAEISNDIKKQTILTDMLTKNLSQCQASLSFLHDQFSIAGDIKIMNGENPENLLPIIKKLSEDFNIIETKQLPQVREFFVKNGMNKEFIIQNERLLFELFKQDYIKNLYLTPRQNRGKFIQTVLAYAGTCTQNAQWMVDSFTN